MAPLNTDRNASESLFAEQSGINDDEMMQSADVREEMSRNLNQFVQTGSVCKRRLSGNEGFQMASAGKNLQSDNKQYCENRSANSTKQQTLCGASASEDDEADTHSDCDKKDTKIDKCTDCAKIAKTLKYSIYHKHTSDGIVPNSSIRAALYQMSPKWLKTIMNEPEYVMSEIKQKNTDLIHRQADSLFSTSSGFTNYRGLLNLCIILLVLANARLFLENIIKYGILVDPFLLVRIAWNQPYSGSNIALVLGSNVFILAIFYTEKAMAKSWFSETTALVIQSINLVLLLTIPAAVVLYLHPSPLLSTTVLGMYTVMFLKLVSYASVNKWCRQAQSPRRRGIKRSKSVCATNGNPLDDEDETSATFYPDNLTYSDLYYFMAAPTLCYELNFPRSFRIRKRFLLKRIIEMLFIIQLIMGCIQQWILPLVNNSLKPLADMDAARCVERLLKLAVPNHFIWLMFFYWFFHSSLNVLAELLRFGDREFYKDWWNSDTVNEFWQLWNVPVHRWASRHLYKPLVRRGCNRLHASVVVFFVSAFFHEYLLSVPLQMFRLWAFMGMLGQVPLALIQTKYIHGKFGNMVVWLSLILGQPIAILAYFHDYYVMHIANQTAPAV